MMTYKIIYDNKRIEIIPARYQKGNRIALQAYDGNEPYATLTVNLPEFDDLISDRYIFMDENNVPGITAALKEACLIEPTGLDAPSGFCKYPVVLWRG